MGADHSVPCGQRKAVESQVSGGGVQPGPVGRDGVGDFDFRDIDIAALGMRRLLGRK